MWFSVERRKSISFRIGEIGGRFKSIVSFWGGDRDTIYYFCSLEVFFVLE